MIYIVRLAERMRMGYKGSGGAVGLEYLPKAHPVDLRVAQQPVGVKPVGKEVVAAAGKHGGLPAVKHGQTAFVAGFFCGFVSAAVVKAIFLPLILRLSDYHMVGYYYTGVAELAVGAHGLGSRCVSARR